jgi:HEAT repeat protein
VVLSVILFAFAQTTEHPSKSASKLVEQFKSTTDIWTQFEVAKKIVALRDKSALQDLEPWLSNADMHQRGNAAFIFASLGDDRGFQVIKTILEGRPTYTINLGNPDPRLQIRWDGYSAEDRHYACHLFGDLQDARAVPILVPLLKDKEVKWIVPWSLGQIGDKSAIAPLMETLDDKSPDMRVLAIYALEQLDAKKALPKIRARLGDNEKTHFDGLVSVADAAREAIIKLRRRP